MSDYDFCEKHQVSFLVPEMPECPGCYLERLRDRANGAKKPGAVLNQYDAEVLEEVVAYLDREHWKNEK